MALYKCLSCKKDMGSNDVKKLQCPYCGGKIFYKVRVIEKKIKAR